MKDLEIKLRELSLALYRIGAIKFGSFKLKSGLDAPVYIDMRLIVSHPAVLELMATALSEFIKHLNLRSSLICGVPYTALPIASCVAFLLKTPMCVRRKEPKCYGTMKQIDGVFKKGDDCLVIEDVITSGGSLIETVQELQAAELVVQDVVVMLDRGQGGPDNLKAKGLNVHCLLTFKKVAEYLLHEGLLASEVVDPVLNFLKTNQTSLNERDATKRLQTPFDKRLNFVKNEISRRILSTMVKKKTNLCVAADVTSSKSLLDLVDSVGPHVCIVKTHFDAVLDWSEETEIKLTELARKHDFLIMEDRKYADIGRTVSLQLSKIFKWADLVTMHSVAGPASITAASQAAASVSSSRGVFLVAQLSSSGNLISSTYSDSTGLLAQQNTGIVVGLVCQSPNLVNDLGLLQLTPGVSPTKEQDNLGQTYVSPEASVLNKGGDIIVVGRGITESNSPGEEALSLKTRLWDACTQRFSQ